MSLESYLSADTFLHIPAKTPANATRSNIVFFIPGNPGLLSYYHEFLSTVATSSSVANCITAGFSLGGFDVSLSTPPNPVAQIQHPAGSATGPIYSLRDQVDLTFSRVKSLVASLKHAPTQGDTSLYNVILIGHSVGAYIALEVIRRLHGEHAHLDPGQKAAYTITGAVLLTPTVIEIAKSSHGRVVTPLLTYAPFLDDLAQWAVWGLIRTLPSSALEGLVGRLTGMKGEKLQTTVSWLRSERGVKQTVFMGGQEMREMGADTWGEEVWGAVGDLDGEAARGGWKAPKLVLYFARKDHWIDDATREAIVKTRRKVDLEVSKGKSWPRIEVEESGKLVHGWCIGQSREVAEKVEQWIKEIVEQ